MYRETTGQQLKYELVMIENLVPENHILRKIDKVIDFSFINEICRPYYSDKELFSIFNSFCEKVGLALDDNAADVLTNYLEWLMNNKPDNFANGREMRNLFEKMYENQANRLANSTSISDSELSTFIFDDFPEYVSKSQKVNE